MSSIVLIVATWIALSLGVMFGDKCWYLLRPWVLSFWAEMKNQQITLDSVKHRVERTTVPYAANSLMATAVEVSHETLVTCKEYPNKTFHVAQHRNWSVGDSVLITVWLRKDKVISYHL